MADHGINDDWQDLDLGVDPTNQATSPRGSKRRRAYLSCERCRKRKARCEPASDQNEPCKRCSEDSQPCEFRTSRRTKRKLPLPVNDVGQNYAETLFSNTGSSSVVDRGALVPSVNQEEFIEERLATDSSQGLSTTAALDARARLVSTHIHNTLDALDLLTFAAADKQAYTSPSATSTRGSQVSTLTPMAVASNSSRNEDKVWKNFILIRKGIVSQQEVMEYLRFFFDRLWPLKPIVPPYYRDKSTHVQLVAEEPLLVMCLITLSSRYVSLPGRHGEMKSERIHWQAWRIVQRSLQSVMWGSTTTRSLGAITSMLLLIDWHIKAINNPSDFTEGEDEANGYTDEDAPNFEASPHGSDALTGQRRYGTISLMEKLNIVSPAYRSNKMSWSLLSNAISLAHEGCCFQSESSNSSSASSSQDSVRKEWNRLICVFIYLADESLATRLGLEPLLPEKSRQTVENQFSSTFAKTLPDATVWEGYLALSIKTQKGRELLHSLKVADALSSDRNLVANLRNLQLGLDSWKQQYYHPDDTSLLLKACLHMEFHYMTLFCFTPAAQAMQVGSKALPLEALWALSGFKDKATQASHALLSIVVDVLKPSELTKYLPVRCWSFIVAASLHLLKATLTSSQGVNHAHPNILLLRSVVDALHSGSPDDSHMAIRYAKFLGIMIQIALPTASNNPDTSSRIEVEEHSNDAELPKGSEFEEATRTSLFNHVDIEGISDWGDFSDTELGLDPFTWWESTNG
ncbi:hypothetical protein FSARC_12646 [Fusarium sarcochroum]|uniref:Zn(2)-C6 fungal-type domain-containing protein n=1 Tax=Fusarium sarcochroum TaxID=1208366 RepID=A0A8H4WWJ0_9HYPO|nr:hypothetical protein FSARC_12646 [Fusarium sarcochroum]